jgi:hypothetical protein
MPVTIPPSKRAELRTYSKVVLILALEGPEMVLHLLNISTHKK